MPYRPPLLLSIGPYRRDQPLRFVGHPSSYRSRAPPSACRPDIMSISDAGKLAQNTVKGVFDDSVPSVKRFGIGGKGEASCETFRAFLACRGYLSFEKRAVELPYGSNLGDARRAFGRPMRQTRILDEDGYELDAASPVWLYSKNCNISLTFDYDKKTELDIAAESCRKTFAAKPASPSWNPFDKAPEPPPPKESAFSALNSFARKPDKET
jgi:hypothetical protein